MKNHLICPSVLSERGCRRCLGRLHRPSPRNWKPKPADPYFAKFAPLKAPADGRDCMLHDGDRLAIIGDSITEQKMYSRIIETYLTVCVPQLNITARQFGWSGETAEGFLHRMTNDCLRFQADRRHALLRHERLSLPRLHR